MYVFTDGENLFVATGVRKAEAMFAIAFGGDTVRDYGVRLRKMRPHQICTLLDDDREHRLQSRTVARLYPGETILVQ